MKITNATEAKIHFYYCLTVALKMARKYAEVNSSAQANLFALRWIINARKKKIFPHSAATEIDWLQAYLCKKGPFFEHTEKLVTHIYATSQDLLKAVSRENSQYH
ncbi:hypothetical protein [Pantoea anthophila]|uniref:hypothetical protein n=1 Tax=Pantoea anthophila TaxID=470931 RepID=UPI003CFA3E4D